MKIGDADFEKELRRIYGDGAKVVHIDLLYQKEAWDYVMGIEEAHKKAAHSKLTFP